MDIPREDEQWLIDRDCVRQYPALLPTRRPFGMKMLITSIIYRIVNTSKYLNIYTPLHIKAKDS